MTRKTALLGLFCALAVICGYVESLFPVAVGIPGIKIGLANLSVLYLLDRYGWREAFAVSLVRILIIGFLFGSLFGILYSLAGAAFSLFCMTLLRKRGKTGLLTASVCGGIAHNMAQLVTAVLLVNNAKLFVYGPVLFLSGMFAGLLVGFLTGQVEMRIDRIHPEKGAERI